MTKIIAFGGKKQSGKDSCCKFLSGLILTSRKCISGFNFDDSGRFSLFDEDETDINTIEPSLVKVYSFADELKRFCHEVLNIKPVFLYGSNTQKNQHTHLRWRDMPGIVTNKTLYNWLKKSIQRKQKINYDYQGIVNITYHEDNFMTGREVMQFMGTEVIRQMYSDAWVTNTFYRIQRDNPEFAFISDLRMPNEFSATKKYNGFCIKLLRQLNGKTDQHLSEVDVEKIPVDQWDMVIDNRAYSMYNLKQHLTNEIKIRDLIAP